VPEIQNAADNLKVLINKSSRIVVTSHIAPDPDAASSTLLLGRTLKENFPGKKVAMVLEEEPLTDISFLVGYNELEFANLWQKIQTLSPDLLIIVDANTYNRVSRNESEQIRQYAVLHKDMLKTAIIDHHELDGKDNSTVFINNKRPACAEEIYALCFEQLNFKQPNGCAETTLLGIISDTQRHKFDHPGYRETYRITAELLDAGASIEKLESRLEHYTKYELEVINHLAGNIVSSGAGYTYTFVNDNFAKEWQKAEKPLTDLKNGVEFFVGHIIRNFENNQWGFVVYPDYVAGDDCWGVSFRSLSGIKDVSALARQLGGGGHKPAAGAKVQAGSVNEVIQKVKSAIAGS
jgi:phosphoesterase RecJ-like protein